MNQNHILIVDNHAKRTQHLRNAITGVALTRPAHQPDGESAVIWTGANECDLCIICYELPGIDGIETLVRMRNRLPNLTAIIYSESTKQDVAIAAFRAGVIDFIPARGDFARIIAEQAQSVFGEVEPSRTASARDLEDPTLSHIPRERLEPTYQNRLRAIGRQLDVYGYHSATITEVDGGFLVRAQKQRARRPQALEFPDRDFPRLVASAIHDDLKADQKPIQQGDLTPTGYEDMLRALGDKLDDMSAESITVTELEEMLVVAGRGNDEKSSLPGIVPFNLFLKQEEIELMLDDAFNRRGKTQPKVSRPTPNRGGLRNLLRRLN
jgi:DNA-binding NarL/FixJ family response regulator